MGQRIPYPASRQAIHHQISVSGNLLSLFSNGACEENSLEEKKQGMTSILQKEQMVN